MISPSVTIGGFMIGRIKEQKELINAFNSSESEFVAVYGRRRVGKTYLIRNTFDSHFVFQHSGLKKKSTAIQIDRFRESLVEYGYKDCPALKNWYKAFDALKELIKRSSAAKKVIFIDEMPWMDRPNSNFVSAVENFWNGWASARRDVLFIVCGSASSWILRKVVHNKEGLHNRVTFRIPLKPFNLRECAEYAQARDLALTEAQILDLYMVLGGIPYYWHFLDKSLSVAQNIDELFFAGTDKLENEFEELYESLFQCSEPYVKIVSALASRKSGLLRDEIVTGTGIPDSGKLTEMLKDLERCGFVRKYVPMGRVSRGSVYQLIDNFTLFYYQFVQPNHGRERHYWTKMLSSPVHSTWAGLAFERVCLEHIEQIKESLRIGAVLTNEYAWRNSSAQIDLLIDRADGIINLCEMKYASGLYAIDAADDVSLRNKRDELRRETETRKAIHFTFITVYGVKENAYLKNIQSQLTLKDLFR